MTVAAAPKYACARCGKRQRADQMVYSTFTHLRFCRDFNACTRRTKRKRK